MTKEDINAVLNDIYISIEEENDYLIEKVYQYIEQLEEENKSLKELCNNYEEEHSTTFKEWVDGIKKLNKQYEIYDKQMSIIEKMITDLKEVNDNENKV